MAQDHVAPTDKRLGMSIVLGAVAVGGIIAMLAAPGGELAAAGFAIGLLAGLGLIVVLHVDV